DGPWWRSPDLATDLAYWFVVPVFTRFLRIGLLVLGAVVIFDVHGAPAIIDFYEYGHGPWAALPFWLQVVLYLVISDFLLYWIHRIFHGRRMWKYHAVHHSSEHVDWVSAARFHPVNFFVGTFPIFDVLFGTFYMPANALPDDYGVADPAFPKGFAAQLAYPFKNG